MTSREEVLVHGFIQDQRRKLQLSKNIPMDIILLITAYFPVLFRFGLHHKSYFRVSNDKLRIKSKGGSCEGFMIYADLGDKDDIGLNEGIHIWSLLSRAGTFCFRSIGITNFKDDRMVNKTAGRGDFYCYYDGDTDNKQPVWDKNMIFSVELDCDNWKVFFYKEATLLKSQDIDPNKSYFLAVSCCASATSLQSVQSPL